MYDDDLMNVVFDQSKKGLLGRASRLDHHFGIVCLFDLLLGFMLLLVYLFCPMGLMLGNDLVALIKLVEVIIFAYLIYYL